MQFGRIFDVALALVAVAGVTVAVTNKNTADIIKAFGTAFSGSLSSAEGK